MRDGPAIPPTGGSPKAVARKRKDGGGEAAGNGARSGRTGGPEACGNRKRAREIAPLDVDLPYAGGGHLSSRRIRPRPLSLEEPLMVLWAGRDPELYEMDGGQFWDYVKTSEEAVSAGVAPTPIDVSGIDERKKKLLMDPLLNPGVGGGHGDEGPVPMGEQIALPTFREVVGYRVPEAAGPSPRCRGGAGGTGSLPTGEAYIRHRERSNEEYESVVEYDLEEEDCDWLAAFNAEMKTATAKSKRRPLSEEHFEAIVDQLEKESFNELQHRVRPFRLGVVKSRARAQAASAASGAAGGGGGGGAGGAGEGRAGGKVRPAPPHGGPLGGGGACAVCYGTDPIARLAGGAGEKSVVVGSGGGLATPPTSSASIECSQCGLVVHRACYGATGEDRGPNWTCRHCTAASTASCALCGQPGGALKATTDGRWAHVLCALVIPETFFEIQPAMEPIDGIESIDEGRFAEECFACGESGGGACVPCASRGCDKAFHVGCGAGAGCVFQLTQRTGRRPAGRPLCPEHAAKAPGGPPAAAAAGASAGAPAAGDGKAKIAEAAALATGKLMGSEPLPDPEELGCIPLDKALEVVEAPAHLVRAVYHHWLRRRELSGGPLLPRLRAQLAGGGRGDGDDDDVSDEDADGFVPFGGRDSPERKTLRKRKMETSEVWDKMVQMRSDLELVRIITDLTIRREKVKRHQILHRRELALLETNPPPGFDAKTMLSVPGMRRGRPPGGGAGPTPGTAAHAQIINTLENEKAAGKSAKQILVGLGKVPRGPGRPPKNPPQLINIDVGDIPIIIKRGPGRPPKDPVKIAALAAAQQAAAVAAALAARNAGAQGGGAAAAQAAAMAAAAQAAEARKQQLKRDQVAKTEAERVARDKALYAAAAASGRRVAAVAAAQALGARPIVVPSVSPRAPSPSVAAAAAAARRRTRP